MVRWVSGQHLGANGGAQSLHSGPGCERKQEEGTWVLPCLQDMSPIIQSPPPRHTAVVETKPLPGGILMDVEIQRAVAFLKHCLMSLCSIEDFI